MFGVLEFAFNVCQNILPSLWADYWTLSSLRPHSSSAPITLIALGGPGVGASPSASSAAAVLAFFAYFTPHQGACPRELLVVFLQRMEEVKEYAGRSGTNVSCGVQHFESACFFAVLYDRDRGYGEHVVRASLVFVNKQCKPL